MTKTQADICLERHGMTNPTMIQVKCPCEGCIGFLKLDGVTVHGHLGFLMCGECGCTHCIEVSPGSDLSKLAKAQ